MWRTQPDIIRKFLDQQSNYEQLCVEIAYILQKQLQAQNIEIALISKRAKTLNSFLEKIQRKHYSNPFSEIEDFAGVRIVCLYMGDIQKIDKIIKDEFNVVEKVDKFREKAPDQFGYGAIHYIVLLSKNTLGARYDDLKGLKCEVQVRTVMQDAWAIIDHHLVYKRESDIPSQIQRKLNSLAGLLETADDQFDRIRDERQQYLNDLVETSKHEQAFLSSEINRDSLLTYVEQQFPSLPSETFKYQLNTALEAIDPEKYKTLQELHDAIKPVRSKIGDILASIDNSGDSGIFRMAILLAVVDKDYRSHLAMPRDLRSSLEETIDKVLF